ncbi:MAG: hypothetical protein IPH31_20975 [Lewinellaceae bacterium]|nr:hypothetical protein [Lewinellaceae bacterium]
MNGEQWQFKSFEVNTGKQMTIRTFIENDGGWGSLTPDLQYFFTSPVVDVADVRAGMSAYSILTGKFSHYFGLKMLETTTEGQYGWSRNSRYTNRGKMMLIKRDILSGTRKTSFLRSGNWSAGGMDSLKFCRKPNAQEDKNPALESRDTSHNNSMIPGSGQLPDSQLCFRLKVWPEFTDTGY